MSAEVRVEVKKNSGDASFMMGLIAGLLIGAALTWVLTADNREPGGEQMALPLDYDGRADPDHAQARADAATWDQKQTSGS